MRTRSSTMDVVEIKRVTSRALKGSSSSSSVHAAPAAAPTMQPPRYPQRRPPKESFCEFDIMENHRAAEKHARRARPPPPQRGHNHRTDFGSDLMRKIKDCAERNKEIEQLYNGVGAFKQNSESSLMALTPSLVIAPTDVKCGDAADTRSRHHLSRKRSLRRDNAKSKHQTVVLSGEPNNEEQTLLRKRSKAKSKEPHKTPESEAKKSVCMNCFGEIEAPEISEAITQSERKRHHRNPRERRNRDTQRRSHEDISNSSKGNKQEQVSLPENLRNPVDAGKKLFSFLSPKRKKEKDPVEAKITRRKEKSRSKSRSDGREIIVQTVLEQSNHLIKHKEEEDEAPITNKDNQQQEQPDRKHEEDIKKLINLFKIKNENISETDEALEKLRKNRKELSISNLNIMPFRGHYYRVENPKTAMTQTSVSKLHRNRSVSPCNIPTVEVVEKKKSRHRSCGSINTKTSSDLLKMNAMKGFSSTLLSEDKVEENFWVGRKIRKDGKAKDIEEVKNEGFRKKRVSSDLSKTTLALKEIYNLGKLEMKNSKMSFEKLMKQNTSLTLSDVSNFSEIMSIQEKQKKNHISRNNKFHTSKTVMPCERVVEISSKVFKNQKVSFTVKGVEPATKLLKASSHSQRKRAESLEIITFPGIQVNTDNITVLNYGTFKSKPFGISKTTVICNKVSLKKVPGFVANKLRKKNCLKKKVCKVSQTKEVETEPEKSKPDLSLIKGEIILQPKMTANSSTQTFFDEKGKLMVIDKAKVETVLHTIEEPKFINGVVQTDSYDEDKVSRKSVSSENVCSYLDIDCCNKPGMGCSECKLLMYIMNSFKKASKKHEMDDVRNVKSESSINKNQIDCIKYSNPYAHECLKNRTDVSKIDIFNKSDEVVEAITDIGSMDVNFNSPQETNVDNTPRELEDNKKSFKSKIPKLQKRKLMLSCSRKIRSKRKLLLELKSKQHSKEILALEKCINNLLKKIYSEKSMPSMNLVETENKEAKKVVEEPVNDNDNKISIQHVFNNKLGISSSASSISFKTSSKELPKIIFMPDSSGTLPLKQKSSSYTDFTRQLPPKDSFFLHEPTYLTKQKSSGDSFLKPPIRKKKKRNKPKRRISNNKILLNDVKKIIKKPSYSSLIDESMTNVVVLAVTSAKALYSSTSICPNKLSKKLIDENSVVDDSLVEVSTVFKTVPSDKGIICKEPFFINQSLEDKSFDSLDSRHSKVFCPLTGLFNFNPPRYAYFVYNTEMIYNKPSKPKEINNNNQNNQPNRFTSFSERPRTANNIVFNILNKNSTPPPSPALPKNLTTWSNLSGKTQPQSKYTSFVQTTQQTKNTAIVFNEIKKDASKKSPKMSHKTFPNFEETNRPPLKTFAQINNATNTNFIINYSNKSSKGSPISARSSKTAEAVPSAETESGYESNKSNNRNTSSLRNLFRFGGSLLEIFRSPSTRGKKSLVAARKTSSILEMDDENFLDVPEGATESKSAMWFNFRKKKRKIVCKDACPNKVLEDPVGKVPDVCKDTCHKSVRESKSTNTDQCRGTNTPKLFHRKCPCIKNYQDQMTECQKYAEKVILESIMRKEGYLKQFNDFKEIPLDVLMGKKVKKLTCKGECLKNKYLSKDIKIGPDEVPKGPKEPKDAKTVKEVPSIGTVGDLKIGREEGSREEEDENESEDESRIPDVEGSDEKKKSNVDDLRVRQRDEKIKSLRSESDASVAKVHEVSGKKLSDQEVFDKLLNHYEKENDIVKRLSKDDEFFHEQISNVVENEDEDEGKNEEKADGTKKPETTSRDPRFNDNTYQNVNKNCIVEADDIGTCFARGFRPDNMMLSGDACFNLNKQDKIRMPSVKGVESMIDFSERETPLDFLLALGFMVDEASNALKDDDIKSRLLAAITEARVWINRITTTQGTLLYLVAYKARPDIMRYFLQLVEAIINKRINDAIKLDGFLHILEQVEDGKIKLVNILGQEKLEDEENEERIVKRQLKQLFVTVYKVAEKECKLKHKEMTNLQVNLLRILVAKYRAGLHHHLELIARYIGQGLLDSEVQLEAAMIYLSRLDTTDVKLKEFENYCGITCEQDKEREKQREREKAQKKDQLMGVDQRKSMVSDNE